MKKVNNLLLYLRHITFIAFLWAGIILFPAFDKFDYGNLCFVFFIIYSIVTIIMFFVKPKFEQDNFLNNLVLCLLHAYFCFIAYKYSGVSDVFGVTNVFYFKLSFSISSLCMFVLTVNKFILANTK